MTNQEVREPMLNAQDQQSSVGDPSLTTSSHLIELCRELIGYLESVEESDSGRQFHPTTIQSCRCLVVERLGQIIPEIKHICETAKSSDALQI